MTWSSGICKHNGVMSCEKGKEAQEGKNRGEGWQEEAAPDSHCAAAGGRNWRGGGTFCAPPLLQHQFAGRRQRRQQHLPKKGLEAYTLGEDTTISLDTLLEEGEGELIALRSPEKPKGDESSNVDTRYTYIYELTNPAEVMNRYLDAVLGGEQGFSLVSEDYVILDEQRPELQDAEGVLILARPSVVEGHIFQLAIGWSQASANLAVRASAPEGAITKPEPEPEPEPTSVSEQMEQLRGMTPAELGLAGASMDNYTIFPVDGFVTVNGQECRRFNLYPQGDTGSIAGTYFLSTDKQHVYVLDPNTNTVSTIR